MQPDPSEPVDLAGPSLDLIRQRVDLWNRRFHALATNLARIDANIADMIGTQSDPDKGQNRKPNRQ